MVLCTAVVYACWVLFNALLKKSRTGFRDARARADRVDASRPRARRGNKVQQPPRFASHGPERSRRVGRLRVARDSQEMVSCMCGTGRRERSRLSWCLGGLAD